MHTYHYVAEIHGIELGVPVAFSNLAPMLRNTSMEQHSSSEVLIRATKSRTWPEDIAMNEARIAVEDLLDRLSLIDNHRIISIKYIGYQNETGEFQESGTSVGSCATGIAGLPDPLAYYEHERQKRLLVGKLNPGLTRLHRTAQGMPNGIGKYLLLYGALQVLFGETQAKVDAALLNSRPDTLLVQGKRRSETILSHLRNMIAHPENDIDVQTLTQQADKYCPMLSEIVRDELIKQVQP